MDPLILFLVIAVLILVFAYLVNLLVVRKLPIEAPIPLLIEIVVWIIALYAIWTRFPG